MYFYPRSPCGERQPSLYQLYDTYAISIHALLAESDTPQSEIIAFDNGFLSTLSLRRATSLSIQRGQWENHFYPRSPCGERHGCCARCHCWGLFLSTLSLRRATVSSHVCLVLLYISIHALLAESDLLKNHIFFHYSLFLSTLSLRRATYSII